MEFEGKVAIVTGAGQGIGFEICRMLAEKGARVFLNDIDAGLASKATDAINATCRDACFAMPGNSADVDFLGDLVGAAAKRFDRLDIAVANAGITSFGDFLTYPHKDFMKVMEVNLGGSFFLAQAAAIQMKRNPAGGRILFTSSVTGHRALKSLAAYSMSKAALEMLARNLVIELSEFNITVNAVAPGATLTERTRQEENYETVWSGITPTGRPAFVADIAGTALFLLSDQARHITGQTVVVDGGWSSLSPLPQGIK